MILHVSWLGHYTLTPMASVHIRKVFSMRYKWDQWSDLIVTELAKLSLPQAKAWQSLPGAFTSDIKILCDEGVVTDVGNEVKLEWGEPVAPRLLATECKAQWSVKALAESAMYERTLPNMASYATGWATANLSGAKNELCWAPKHTWS